MWRATSVRAILTTHSSSSIHDAAFCDCMNRPRTSRITRRHSTSATNVRVATLSPLVVGKEGSDTSRLRTSDVGCGKPTDVFICCAMAHFPVPTDRPLPLLSLFCLFVCRNSSSSSSRDGRGCCGRGATQPQPPGKTRRTTVQLGPRHELHRDGHRTPPRGGFSLPSVPQGEQLSSAKHERTKTYNMNNIYLSIRVLGIICQACICGFPLKRATA